MVYVKRCPECESIDLTYDSQKGEVVCNECGLIVEEKIVDTGQEGGGQFDPLPELPWSLLPDGWISSG